MVRPGLFLFVLVTFRHVHTHTLSHWVMGSVGVWKLAFDPSLLLEYFI